MYSKILITLDVSSSDRVIIDHIKPLAKLLGSQVILLHVADGWAARLFGGDAVSPELVDDTAYLEKIAVEMRDEGIDAKICVAYGEPVEEITKWVEKNHPDLVAMGTHGHKGLADIFLGTTASRVQHNVSVPVLMLRAG